MRLNLFILLMLLMATSVVAQKKSDTVRIKTSTVCEMCRYNIESDLTFEKGVKSMDLDLNEHILTVVYNPDKTDANKIRERVTKIGYDADSLKRDPEAFQKLPFCCRRPDAHKKDH